MQAKLSKEKKKMVEIFPLYKKYSSLYGHYHVAEKGIASDMEFVQNFTPPDFQAKNFTPSISPNFNSFSKKKHKK